MLECPQISNWEPKMQLHLHKYQSASTHSISKYFFQTQCKMAPLHIVLQLQIHWHWMQTHDSAAMYIVLGSFDTVDQIWLNVLLLHGPSHVHFAACLCHKWGNLCCNFLNKILELKILNLIEFRAKHVIIMFSSFVNKSKNKDETKEKVRTRQDKTNTIKNNKKLYYNKKKKRYTCTWKHKIDNGNLL